MAITDKNVGRFGVSLAGFIVTCGILFHAFFHSAHIETGRVDGSEDGGRGDAPAHDDPYAARRHAAAQREDPHEHSAEMESQVQSVQIHDESGTQPETDTRPEADAQTDADDDRVHDQDELEGVHLVVFSPPEEPDQRQPRIEITGDYGGRRAEARRTGAAAMLGATEESEEAVEIALEWFARAQAKDGSWGYDSRAPHSGQSPIDSSGRYSTGVTGLALLAFLGAGYTHLDSRYGQTIAKALRFLRDQTDMKTGRLAQSTFYEQGIATMAFCEAYGMTRSDELLPYATKMVECVVENMGRDGGYGYGGPGDDVHVTSFMVMALKSAQMAGVPIPRAKEAFEKLDEYYAGARNTDGLTGYRASSRGTGGQPRAARTALGLFCPLFLGEPPESPRLATVIDVVAAAGPNVLDPYQCYYGTYSMFQVGGLMWKQWNQAFRDPVIELQEKEGPQTGAWTRDRSRGGIACNTAWRVMSLQVYYRYARAH